MLFPAEGCECCPDAGMGERAKQLFDSLGIKVLVGVTMGNPEQTVRAYLDGSLQVAENVREH